MNGLYIMNKSQFVDGDIENPAWKREEFDKNDTILQVRNFIKQFIP